MEFLESPQVEGGDEAVWGDENSIKTFYVNYSARDGISIAECDLYPSSIALCSCG